MRAYLEYIVRNTVNTAHFDSFIVLTCFYSYCFMFLYVFVLHLCVINDDDDDYQFMVIITATEIIFISVIKTPPELNLVKTEIILRSNYITVNLLVCILVYSVYYCFFWSPGTLNLTIRKLFRLREIILPY